MFNFKLIFLVIFLFKLNEIKSQISDKRLCANENCTKPISLAKTIIKYFGPDHRILSFAQNVDVTIYSKSAGSNMNLWGIEVNGKRGYAPKNYLRETKVFTTTLPYLVDTELNDEQVPSKQIENNDKETIAANKVPDYDVVDGTTIYYSPDEKIAPTTTESYVKPTITSENVNSDTKNEIEVDENNNIETEPLQTNIEMESNEVKDDKGSIESNDSENKVPNIETKESLIDNVYQSIQSWINEPPGDTKKNAKGNDEELSDDEDDDEGEVEEEGDDDEEEEEDDSETSEELEDDLHINNVEEKDATNANIEEMSKIDGEKIEEVVKSRQLLSEKDEDESILTINMEKTVDEEKSNDATSNECPGENCLTKENIQENTSEIIKNEAESVTESSYKEEAAFEIPVPQDFDFVTPNPLQVDEDSSLDNKISENISEDNKISESISDDNKISEDVSEDNKNSDNFDNTVDMDSIEATEEISKENEEIVKENEEIVKENGENEIKVEESAENNQEKSKNEETSEDSEKFVELETNTNENIELSKESNENVEPIKEEILANKENDETKEIEENLENNQSQPPNEPILNDLNQPTEEEVDKQEDVSESDIESTTVINEETKEEENVAEDSSPQNNEENPGILSGIFSNLFQDRKSEEINEDKEQNKIGTIENQDPNKIEEIKHQEEGEIKNDDTETKDEEIGSKKIEDQTTENQKVHQKESEEEKPKDEEIDHIEQHDHSFVSLIKDQNQIISENSDSSDLKLDSVVLEVPKVESEIKENQEAVDQSQNTHDQLLSKQNEDYGSCSIESDCPTIDISALEKQLEMEEELAKSLEYSDYFNLFTVLVITGFSVVLFMLGYISIDKNRREGPLIAKINNLEKALLVSSKENELLTDKITEIQNEAVDETNRISNDELDAMKIAYQELLNIKVSLEDQVQSLEKELENSTEVGLELNRMLQDILSSQNGSEILIANVEQLQRQLVEQQSTINSINDTLNLKDTENHELQLELEIKNKKVTHLQAELDKMAMNLFKVEEDKEQMQGKLENEIIELKDHFEQSKNNFNSTRTKLLDEINALKSKYLETQRNLDLKINEFTILKDNFNQIQAIKNNTEALESLLNASSMKAELQQLQRDNQTLNEVLRQEQQTKFTLEKQVEIALQEAQSYKAKYDDSDKEKLEAQTKLEVLSNYFREKEAQLQKELNKHESLWLEQQGAATSTVERIKYMQEELQNYKLQNESLKQEIISQEVDLKSQISLLEKKGHENWVTARQAERRLEDAKQEAAQLRNRLTLKERSFIEDKTQNRIQSPLEQNGDVAVSPLHMPVESPASPPLLYGTRDHLTTSPPIPNLPPFLPPPPGVPFIPPPIPGVPGFMPPPPSMFPGDHRPPPLGRMSSPPPLMNSRYSPDSRYSPYDRRSPSPPYDDDYGPVSPPLHRGYSPYNNRDDRREYKRPPPPPGRTNGRNKGAMSSGSGNSNESLEKINRHHSKV